MYLNNVVIKINGNEFYKGEFDIDLKCQYEGENLIGFCGELSRYLFGITKVNLALLPSYYGVFYPKQPIYYKGILKAGKVVNEEVYAIKSLEVYLDNELLISSGIRHDFLNPTPSRYDRQNKDFYIPLHIQFSKILENVFKMEEGEYEKLKHLYYENIPRDLLHSDYERPNVDNFMGWGKKYMSSDNEVNRDFSAGGEIYFEKGKTKLNAGNSPVYYEYNGKEINFIVDGKIRWKFVGKFNRKKLKLKDTNDKRCNIHIQLNQFEGQFNNYDHNPIKSYDVCVKPVIENENRDLIKDIFHLNIKREITVEKKSDSSPVTFDDIIGLEKVKNKITEFENKIEFDKKRQEQGLPITSKGNHMVFQGSPGTGKTTIAKKIGKLLNEMGILETDKFIEVSRKDLVGEYIGHTAKRTNEQIKKAMGGILFVDEAYSLVPDATPNDFGSEAITELIAAMENYRDNLILIFAGYENEMNKMLDKNPGMRSRISDYFIFEDYSDQELLSILKIICKTSVYRLEPELEDVAKKSLSLVRKSLDNPETKEYLFGNARGVRNFFDAMHTNLVKRSLNEKNNDLMTFNLEDIEYAKNNMLKRKPDDNVPKNRMGFINN